MRPFEIRAPNRSASDRIRDLKAKTIFKASKIEYQRGINSRKKSITFTKRGLLKNVISNDLKQLLSRGYALCEDGVSYSNDPSSFIANTEIRKRGLLNCSKTKMSKTVKINTQNNLFSHFTKQNLPKIPDESTFPMIASYDSSYCDISLNFGIISGTPCSPAHMNGEGIILDPAGLYKNTCKTEKQNHTQCVGRVENGQTSSYTSERPQG